jgi:hypothetical protein
MFTTGVRKQQNSTRFMRKEMLLYRIQRVS